MMGETSENLGSGQTNDLVRIVVVRVADTGTRGTNTKVVVVVVVVVVGRGPVTAGPTSSGIKLTARACLQTRSDYQLLILALRLQPNTPFVGVKDWFACTNLLDRPRMSMTPTRRNFAA